MSEPRWRADCLHCGWWAINIPVGRIARKIASHAQQGCPHVPVVSRQIDG